MFGTCFIVFCCAVLSVISSFAVILQEKEERASCFTDDDFLCYVTVSVLYFFLTVKWVCIRSLIVAFPCHTNLLFKVKATV